MAQPWNISTDIRTPSINYHHLPPRKFYLQYIVGHKGNPLPPDSYSKLLKVIPANHPNYATKWLNRIHEREDFAAYHPERVTMPLLNRAREVAHQFQKDAWAARHSDGNDAFQEWKGSKLLKLNNYSALYDTRDINPYRYVAHNMDFDKEWQFPKKYDQRLPAWIAKNPDVQYERAKEKREKFSIRDEEYDDLMAEIERNSKKDNLVIEEEDSDLPLPQHRHRKGRKLQRKGKRQHKKKEPYTP